MEDGELLKAAPAETLDSELRIIVVCFVVLGFVLCQLLLIGAGLAIRFSTTIARLYEPGIVIDEAIARTAPHSVATTPMALTPRIAMQVEREKFFRMAKLQEELRRAKSAEGKGSGEAVKNKDTSAMKRGKFAPKYSTLLLKSGSGSKEKTKTTSKEDTNPASKEDVVAPAKRKSKEKSAEAFVAPAQGKSKEKSAEAFVAPAQGKSKEKSAEAFVAPAQGKSKEKSAEDIVAPAKGKSKEKSAEEFVVPAKGKSKEKSAEASV
ncbi:hypothetical protein Y032_0007g3566 [Ancylostoma ceylanicum]|uniref:Uncharacterized protein n=1 Tax=Ancylostoma ceylanicum TaxID=53326 RepID=A0A016VQQ5_9BILA|nr:hypothetical protein Y032_0007g3566 [Ancylostoma ceylanicum]